jgi:hypothetical protein
MKKSTRNLLIAAGAYWFFVLKPKEDAAAKAVAQKLRDVLAPGTPAPVGPVTTTITPGTPAP